MFACITLSTTTGETTDKKLLCDRSKWCFDCVRVVFKPVEKEAVARCVYWDFEK